MAKRRKKYQKKKQISFKLPSEAKKIIGYWRDSLIDAGRMEISAYEVSREGALISLDEIKDALCAPELTQAILDKQNQSFSKNRSRDQDHSQRFKTTATEDIEILICPIRLEKENSSTPGPQYLEPIWIPAKISASSGRLSMPQRAKAWIPRSLLEPLPEDSYVAIGDVQKVENFYTKLKGAEPRSWDEYLKLSETFFKKITGSRLEKFSLPDYRQLNDGILIIDNKSGGARNSLIRLYEELLAGRRPLGVLAELCKLKNNKFKSYSYSHSKLKSSALKHCGQFEDSFPLSYSQRLAVHRFFETKSGQVQCVTGPPGTGKTTFLQSVIASLWVKSAILGERPPIIVACSETNKSVTNIIDSFKKAGNNSAVLEIRWLPQVNSYGTFCCSEFKAKEMKGYQLELRSGQGFSKDLLKASYIKEAEKYFLTAFNHHSGKKLKLKAAVSYLRAELKKEYANLYRDLQTSLDGSFLDSLKILLALKRPAPFKDAISKLGDFDTTRRYKCFLLATHYWEGRWLLEASEQLSKRARLEKSRVNFFAKKEDWQHRAMLSPAFVSTLSMAPRFFSYQDEKGQPIVDLLIYDEAGQISPETGAACFALANKALVVGDTLQLEPTWEITKDVDISNLRKNSVIKQGSDDEFLSLKRRGVLASSNSFMELALRSSSYLEENSIGVFLSEHRRYVPELVEFSNAIAYRGRLIPMREEIATRILPAFAYAHIAGKSEQDGPSRINHLEAESIAGWLRKREKELQDFYHDKKLSELVGVITPFAAQARLLKRHLHPHFPGMMIGTVNSLQGAERDIIIFSSAYDRFFDGRYFFDKSPNFLNVAVSRSKDSFIVFGDMEIFDSRKDTPSGLLAKFLFKHDENEIVDIEPVARIKTDTQKLERFFTLEQHQRALTEAFLTAKKRLLITSPTISIAAIKHDNISDLIRSTIERGVKVVIYTDSDLDLERETNQLRENASLGHKAIIEAGATLKVARAIHNKSIAIDDHTLIEGSFNWLSAVRRRTSKHQKLETSLCDRSENAKVEIEKLEKELEHRSRG